ncbi:hypothetical protein [Paenibacillus thalictri]|uniref:hypothetical protein n=1 Tax=Paenibacillus thalictri TaxID=2527873 RepID=UPI0013EF2245|nr:hypothetical protein [Paenibacillus thalictri]
MLTAANDQVCTKESVIEILNRMELNQIANWLRILPEERWRGMFLTHWPTLAKKCGLRD